MHIYFCAKDITENGSCHVCCRFIACRTSPGSPVTNFAHALPAVQNHPSLIFVITPGSPPRHPPTMATTG